MRRRKSWPPTEKQQAVRDRFREAKDYAKEASKTEPAYAEKAEGTPLSAYNVAIADWFHPPEVEEVDLGAYTGQPGQALRARVRDDVKGAPVRFVIAAEDGTLVEDGPAVQAGGWWAYTTTATHPGGTAKVLVVAADLPGHQAQAQEAKTIQ